MLQSVRRAIQNAASSLTRLVYIEANRGAASAGLVTYMERISQLHHRSSRVGRVTDILTTRERQVLLAYAEGCGRREISSRFQISPNTVSHALTLAKEKLGARSIPQAAVLFSLWFDAGRG